MSEVQKSGIIRRAVASDLEAVNRLLEQVLQVHHSGRPDLFQASGKKYSDAELTAIFEDDSRPVFVYEKGGAESSDGQCQESGKPCVCGEVLGYVFCCISEASGAQLKPVKSMYIDDLCVDSDARGRHIGKALFEHARKFAVSEGCHNITLHVWECNPSARAFYDSLGLVPQYTSLEMVL